MGVAGEPLDVGDSNPSVSVCLCTHNGAGVVDRAVRSALTQSYYGARQISRCLARSERVLNEWSLEVVAHDLRGACP